MPKIARTTHRFHQALAAGVAAVALVSLGVGAARADTATLTVAMAANPQMETAEKLINAFYAKYPNIKVKF